MQLEAMAAGRIALAFDQPRSGMGWVGQLSGLPVAVTRRVGGMLQRLADQPQMRNLMGLKSRDRYTTLFARSVWLDQLSSLKSVENG